MTRKTTFFGNLPYKLITKKKNCLFAMKLVNNTPILFPSNDNRFRLEVSDIKEVESVSARILINNESYPMEYDRSQDGKAYYYFDLPDTILPIGVKYYFQVKSRWKNTLPVFFSWLFFFSTRTKTYILKDCNGEPFEVSSLDLISGKIVRFYGDVAVGGSVGFQMWYPHKAPASSHDPPIGDRKTILCRNLTSNEIQVEITFPAATSLQFIYDHDPNTPVDSIVKTLGPYESFILPRFVSSSDGHIDEGEIKITCDDCSAPLNWLNNYTAKCRIDHHDAPAP